MLVLTRKSEQKITIGKNKQITITVLRIKGDKVSLGIEADPDTPVIRNELLQKEREQTENHERLSHRDPLSIKS